MVMDHDMYIGKIEMPDLKRSKKKVLTLEELTECRLLVGQINWLSQ